MIALLALLAATPPMANEPQRTISVSGSAQVRVAPDIVQLMLAIVTHDKAIIKAKSLNDERTSKTLAAMKKFGIEAKDLQTDRISISASFDSNESRIRDEPDSFEVSRSIVVTLRDVKRFEDLLTTAIAAGANRTEGIDFQSSALRKHRDLARAQSVKAAKEKAIALAKELDATIGKPLSISETSSSGYWGWNGGGMRGGGMQQNVYLQSAGGSSNGADGASDRFAPGQIEVNASVSITFELE